MKNILINLFLAANMLLPSLTLAGNEPFNTTELAQVKGYLLGNIATASNKVDKYDEGRMIYSLPGAVLASPSRFGNNFSQDYQFHWTRDAALTMQEIIYLYLHADQAEKNRLKTYLLNYIDFEYKAQHQSSHSGEETLGQPKFNIDGTIWEGEWARPQNDGPALRAQALIQIANIFLAEGDKRFVQEKLTEMITTDLDYVARVWTQSNYDLWEEVNDQDHFFNKIVQRKAFINGALLMRRLSDNTRANSYSSIASQLTNSLQGHWNESRGYLSETINQQYYKGGGLDTSILLGVLYGDLHDATDPFAITNDRVMSSIYYLRNAFAGLYRVNIMNRQLPPLLGRYTSDIYDGNHFTYGNPWILITNALAEYYYTSAKRLVEQKEIRVTANNILFFQQISPELINHEGVIKLDKNREQFNAIIQALIHEGDQLLVNIKQYGVCYDDGGCLHFAEQIDRASGKQVSAKDLSWGYATLLTAMQARSLALSIN